MVVFMHIQRLKQSFQKQILFSTKQIQIFIFSTSKTKQQTLLSLFFKKFILYFKHNNRLYSLSNFSLTNIFLYISLKL